MAWKHVLLLAISAASWTTITATPQDGDVAAASVPAAAVVPDQPAPGAYSAQQEESSDSLPAPLPEAESLPPGSFYQPDAETPQLGGIVEKQEEQQQEEDELEAPSRPLPRMQPQPQPQPQLPKDAYPPLAPSPLPSPPNQLATEPAPPPVDARYCKLLPTDPDWPQRAVWDAELRGWEPIVPRGHSRHPQVMYEVKTVANVQQAVLFAARHRIRLSIVNSGHDFLGRNDAPSGILLDVSGLKGARLVDLNSFIEEDAAERNTSAKYKREANQNAETATAAVTFGAGMSTSELNNELGRSHLWTVGAAHGEVTVAGGWGLAGGHGTLTHRYGLGADNALQFKVVTADGNVTIANRAVNPDLFWALRGGGGSTFGVVVEATYKAYPMPKVYGYHFFLNTSDYNDRHSIYAPAAYFASQIPRIMDEGGMAGYVYMHPNAIRGELYAPNQFANARNMQKIMNSVLDRMAAMPGMSSDLLIKLPPWQGGRVDLGAMFRGLPPMLGSTATNLGYPLGKVPREPWNPGINLGAAGAMGGRFGGLFGGLFGAGSSTPSSFDTSYSAARRQASEVSKRHEPGEGMRVPRGIQDMDSRLFGTQELNSPELAEALRRSMPANLPGGQIRFHLVAGPKVWQSGHDTSVNPAWRRTYAHLLASGGGTPNAQALRDMSPDMGAYVNEAWIHNPNWKHDFWGSNYPRLSDIKTRLDPNMVFYVTPGINADHIQVSGDRLCLVRGALPATPLNAAPIGDNKNVAPFIKDYVSFPRLAA